MAESAKSTMQNVVDSIERTSTTIDEISTATQEQSVGISEINSAIVQLDQVTQKNAALVEEAAAAAQTMKSQSEHLAHVVEFFKVDQEPGKMSELAKKIVKSVPRLK